MAIEALFTSIDISASGLSAQRVRMNAVASNIANVDTTRTDEGGPYRRRLAVMRAGKETTFLRMLEMVYTKLKQTHPRHLPYRETIVVEEGPPGFPVETTVVKDTRDFKMLFNPDHPDADEDGYVAMPNINLVTEMVDMMTATRAYEANVTAIDAAKDMARRALDI